MKLPKELTTVTTLSKTMALIIVVTTPIIGFLLGVKYQKKVDQLYSQQDNNLAQSQNINARGELQFSNGRVIYNFIDESANQDNLKLISIGTIIPPTDKKFKNNEEAVKDIVDYYASSTSQYLSPELNNISQLSQSTVKIEDSTTSLPVYRYEINWEVDPNAGDFDKGTDVWYFIPISKTTNQIDSSHSTFLWLSYDKKYETKLSPIVNSLTLKIQ